MSQISERMLTNYVNMLRSRKLLIIGGWIVLAVILGFAGALHLIARTKNQFDLPNGSEAAIAFDELTRYFSTADSNGTDLIYFEALIGSTVFSQRLVFRMTQEAELFLTKDIEDALACPSVYGYVRAADRYGDEAATMFLGKGNASTVLQINYPSKSTKAYGRVLERLVLHLSHAFGSEISFVGCAGTACSSVETIDATAESVSLMDEISLPLAFLILAYCLKSIRLLLIPLLSVFCSSLVSFGIMGCLAAGGLKVSSVTPPVMMSTLIAVSIDYALFLLTRFKEEIPYTSTVDEAVHRMLSFSGHVVLTSGVILSLCFVSLLFIPVAIVQSLGTGVIVTLISALSVNLSFVPAMLMALPNFFVEFRRWGCVFSSRTAGASQQPSSLLDAMGPVSRESEDSRIWQRWSYFATSGKAAVLVALIVLIGGVVSLITMSDMHPSQDTSLFQPRDSSSSLTQSRLAESFSVGQSGPFKLLFIPKKLTAAGIYEEQFWLQAGIVMETISHLYDGDTEGSIASIMYAYDARKGKGRHLPMEAAMFLDPLLNSSRFCEKLPTLRTECEVYAQTKRCSDLVPLAPVLALFAPELSTDQIKNYCELYRAQLESSTSFYSPAMASQGNNSVRTAFLATLTPSRVPASQAAVDWTKSCRNILHTGAFTPAVQTYLYGVTPAIVDSIAAVYEILPVVLTLTLLVCSVLVGAFNRSVVLGILPVAFIAWTILVVFAFAVLVYQEGIFGTSGVLGSTGGLAWLVPCLTFTVILGLGLDYCIFLLGRVVELHVEGCSDRDALMQGLTKTGPIITNAGIIMAVAYGGLMFSSIPMLNQVSLILVTAVLLDTFFIRSLQFPATHAPLKKWNWWPRRVHDVRADVVIEAS
eukprot:TRINITY_DN19490_c0_g1_i1.p1 TRINITY_DN19490_c0_g1~~TRINITY_DN19490_c0_g1_i1.p1  ORF type:complete len:872 (-),score=77.19 TRINITY_DN19490_c0_g1_i1:183-2798(-)